MFNLLPSRTKKIIHHKIALLIRTKCLWEPLSKIQWHTAQEQKYLDDGRVLGERARWFGRLTHRQVLDVAAPEDDVLKDVVSGRNGPVRRAILGTKGADWGKENSECESQFDS